MNESAKYATRNIYVHIEHAQKISFVYTSERTIPEDKDDDDDDDGYNDDDDPCKKSAENE